MGMVMEILQTILTLVLIVVLVVAVPFLFMVVFSFAFGTPAPPGASHRATTPPIGSDEPEDASEDHRAA